jgi:hypothetical protein
MGRERCRRCGYRARARCAGACRATAAATGCDPAHHVLEADAGLLLQRVREDVVHCEGGGQWVGQALRAAAARAACCCAPRAAAAAARGGGGSGAGGAACGGCVRGCRRSMRGAPVSRGTESASRVPLAAAVAAAARTAARAIAPAAIAADAGMPAMRYWLQLLRACARPMAVPPPFAAAGVCSVFPPVLAPCAGRATGSRVSGPARMRAGSALAGGEGVARGEQGCSGSGARAGGAL